MKIINNSVWATKNIVGLNDAVYRVIQLYVESESMILYELSDRKTSRPRFFYIEHFSRGVQEGLIQPFDEQIPPWMLVTEDNIPEQHRSRRDKNYALVSPLLNDPDFLYMYAINQRSTLVRQYARGNDISYSSVKKLLNLCWKYGRGKQSLLPAYARSGGTAFPTCLY